MGCERRRGTVLGTLRAEGLRPGAAALLETRRQVKPPQIPRGAPAASPPPRVGEVSQRRRTGRVPKHQVNRLSAWSLLAEGSRPAGWSRGAILLRKGIQRCPVSECSPECAPFHWKCRLGRV